MTNDLRRRDQHKRERVGAWIKNAVRPDIGGLDPFVW